MEAGLAADACLVVSELVTNAVLHAPGPLELRLWMVGAAVRIEVLDGSTSPVVPKVRTPALTVASLLDDDADLEAVEELLMVGATTGRGLRLVENLSSAWGWAPRPDGGGKSVWALVGQPAEPVAPAEAELAAPAEAEPGAAARPQAAAERPAAVWPAAGPEEAGASPAGSHPVRLVAVPVWLALESELNLDTLIRELQMIEVAGGVPDTAVGQVAAARQFLDELGRARLAAQVHLHRALERGDRLLDADVLVPLPSVPLLPGLIDLLDEVAGYCERGELLALAPSPAVRGFRRWWTEEIVRQVGGKPPRPCPFSTIASEQATADAGRGELAAEARALIDRVEADLAGTTDLQELVRVFLSQTVSSLGASHASLGLVAADSHRVELIDSIGMPGPVSRHWTDTAVSDDLPASEAIRTGQPVMVRTRSELFLRYPAFRGTPVVDDGSFVSVPLTPTGAGPGGSIGTLNLSFTTSRELTSGQLMLLCAVGSKVADALGRLTGDRRDEEAAARRRAFERIVAGAPRGSGVEDCLRWAVEGLAELFEGWSASFLAGPDGRISMVAVRDTDSERDGLLRQIGRRWPQRNNSGVVRRCLSSGEPVVFQVVPDDMAERVARDAEHLQMLRRVALNSFMIVPVRVDGEMRAAIGVGRHDGRFLTDADVRLVVDLGRALGT